MKLDSHQHFWSYDPSQYPWIDQPKQAIARDFLPDDLLAAQRPLGFTGSIAVQARQSVAESEWLLRLSDSHSLIKGVVGWVDLRSPHVRTDLQRLAQHPRFCGVRHVVQDEPDDRFMLGAEFLRGIAALQEFDLAYDLLVFPHQLPASIELASRFPAQRFVLDHIAKPQIASGALEPWATQIRELAAFPNVFCKVSGMVTETRWGGWKPEDFKPYIQVVHDTFGADRLMFGSDWPVCLLSGSYPQVHDIAAAYSAQLDPIAQSKFFGLNAAAFYKLKP